MLLRPPRLLVLSGREPAQGRVDALPHVHLINEPADLIVRVVKVFVIR
jgi:hypothetical protein